MRKIHSENAAQFKFTYNWLIHEIQLFNSIYLGKVFGKEIWFDLLKTCHLNIFKKIFDELVFLLGIIIIIHLREEDV